MLLGLRLFGYAEGGTIYQSMEDDRGDRGGVALAFIYVSLISIKVPLFFFFWVQLISIQVARRKLVRERESVMLAGMEAILLCIHSITSKYIT